MARAARTARAGNTDKVSVSIDRADLRFLRKRAERLYAGNLSAVIAEGVRRIREEEGREALVEWLGSAADMTEAEASTIRSEWQRSPKKARRRGRAA